MKTAVLDGLAAATRSHAGPIARAERRFTMDLVPGTIGVADTAEAMTTAFAMIG